VFAFLSVRGVRTLIPNMTDYTFTLSVMTTPNSNDVVKIHSLGASGGLVVSVRTIWGPSLHDVHPPLFADTLFEDMSQFPQTAIIFLLSSREHPSSHVLSGGIRV